MQLSFGRNISNTSAIVLPGFPNTRKLRPVKHEFLKWLLNRRLIANKRKKENKRTEECKSLISMWFLPSFIAFVKERFHNAVEIDILGIFEGYSSLQICPPTPKKKFSGAKWRNFHQARVLYLTEVLVCFLVEFDLLVAFGVLSCRILDCASLFIYVYEHDRLCFPMLTEETAVFDRLHLLT